MNDFGFKKQLLAYLGKNTTQRFLPLKFLTGAALESPCAVIPARGGINFNWMYRKVIKTKRHKDEKTLQKGGINFNSIYGSLEYLLKNVLKKQK